MGGNARLSKIYLTIDFDYTNGFAKLLLKSKDSFYSEVGDLIVYETNESESLLAHS